MGLLHPDLWRELAPEFEARALVTQAIEILSEASDTAPVALTKKKLEETLRCFHPATQDAASVEEYEARRDGTYEEPQQQGFRARQSADPRRLSADKASSSTGNTPQNAEKTAIAPADNRQQSADNQQIAELMRSQMQLLEQMSQRLTKLEEQPAQQPPQQPGQ